jgi:hypothetical protein
VRPGLSHLVLALRSLGRKDIVQALAEFTMHWLKCTSTVESPRSEAGGTGIRKYTESVLERGSDGITHGISNRRRGLPARACRARHSAAWQLVVNEGCERVDLKIEAAGHAHFNWSLQIRTSIRQFDASKSHEERPKHFTALFGSLT